MMYFPRLSLRCQFEIVEVGGEVSAVSVGGGENNFNGVILLKNETTRFLFEQLQQGITAPELIQACMEKFNENSIEEVGPKVMWFLDEMKENGLLVADPEHGIRVNDKRK